MRHNMAGDDLDCADMPVPRRGCVAGYAERSADFRGRARLAAGKDLYVVVEFDGVATSAAANAERSRRGLIRDDSAILAQRTAGYAASKTRVETEAGGADAEQIRRDERHPVPRRSV
jgi:hypothetical protein